MANLGGIILANIPTEHGDAVLVCCCFGVCVCLCVCVWIYLLSMWSHIFCLSVDLTNGCVVCKYFFSSSVHFQYCTNCVNYEVVGPLVLSVNVHEWYL